MTIYYVDPANGNDAAAGTSWGTAWKTLNNGATSARLGTGDSDEIRIAKSADPVSIGNLTWTNNSNNITFTGCTNQLVDNCDSGWTAGLVTPTYPTTTYRQGTASTQVVLASTSGKVAYKTLTSTDYSSASRLTFWVNFSTAVNYSAGTPITITLCSDTAGATPVVTFTLPSYYYPPNFWVPITVTPSSGSFAAATAVQSIAINTTSAVTNTIRFDNITTAGSETSGTSIVLTDMIAKNDGSGQYYTIASIEGTTLYIDNVFGGNATKNVTAYTQYYNLGGTETVDTVKRWGFDTAGVITAGATGTQVNVLISTNSGTSWTGIKTYVGGYDTATDTVTGETWFDGVTSYGYGINRTDNYGNAAMNNIGTCRFTRGFNVQPSTTLYINNCSSVNCSIGAEMAGVGADNLANSYNMNDIRFKWILLCWGSTYTLRYEPSSNLAYGPPNRAAYVEITNAVQQNGRTNPAPFFIHIANTSGKFVSTGTLLRRVNPGFNSTSALNFPATGRMQLEINNVITTTENYNVVFGGLGEFSLEPCTIIVTGLIGAADGQGLGVGLGASDYQCPYGITLEGNGATARFGIRYMRSLRAPWTVKNIQHQGVANNFRMDSTATAVGRARVTFHNFNNVSGDHRVYEQSSGPNNNYWQSQSSVTYSGTSAWMFTQGTGQGAHASMVLGNVVYKANSLVTITLRGRRTSANLIAGLLLAPSNSSTPTAYAEVSTTNDWQLLTISFTPADAGSATLTVYTSPIGGNTGTAGTVYFDDLQVTQA